MLYCLYKYRHISTLQQELLYAVQLSSITTLAHCNRSFCVQSSCRVSPHQHIATGAFVCSPAVEYHHISSLQQELLYAVQLSSISTLQQELLCAVQLSSITTLAHCNRSFCMQSSCRVFMYQLAMKVQVNSCPDY